jgi:hypothetical protein
MDTFEHIGGLLETLTSEPLKPLRIFPIARTTGTALLRCNKAMGNA